MTKLMEFLNKVFLFFDQHVIYRLANIEIKDIIDIVLLSLILFFLFRFIIERRASRLALGLLLLEVLMLVTSSFKMHALSFILENFFQAGIIALIVVFQPELRSALEKVGNAPISNIKSISADIKNSSYVSDTIKTLADAVCALSAEKTGALIVIERSTKLGEYIKTGTTLNAQLNVPIIKNIFYNKAPLHDGAVILRNYRVFAAGCFLPLSTNENIYSELGTRHRAAIGITEVSDAVVVVVSEETGTISIAADGVLKQNYTNKSLKNELSKLLLPSDAQSKSSKNTKHKSASQEESK